MLAVFLASVKEDTSFCTAAPFWAISVMSTPAGASCRRAALKTRLAYVACEPARTAGVAWTPSPNCSCLNRGAAGQRGQVCTAHGGQRTRSGDLQLTPLQRLGSHLGADPLNSSCSWCPSLFLVSKCLN